MKRIWIVFTVVLLMMTLALPCFAETATEENVWVQIFGFDIVTEGYNWIMGHKDDIMAGVLLVAAALYKWGSGVLKKKVIPKLEAQSDTTTNIATAAGKLTQANKEYFKQALEEVKAVMAEGGEREKVFLQAVEVLEKSKEEYRLMCEQMIDQNDKLRAALMAEGQMVYEALMSAKLTDARREEIEAKYLKLRSEYEALTAEKTGGDTDEAVVAEVA